MKIPSPGKSESVSAADLNFGSAPEHNPKLQFVMPVERNLLIFKAMQLIYIVLDRPGFGTVNRPLLQRVVNGQL